MTGLSYPISFMAPPFGRVPADDAWFQSGSDAMAQRVLADTEEFAQRAYQQFDIIYIMRNSRGAR